MRERGRRPVPEIEPGDSPPLEHQRFQAIPRQPIRSTHAVKT